MNRHHPLIFLLLPAMFAVFLTGCLFGDDASDDPGTGSLFVVETDFQSGLLEWMDTDNSTMGSGNVSIASDAVARTYNGSIYILERFGADNVLKFDPSKTDESGVVYQTHLGDNYNPQDMEFISGTKAYVSNQNVPKITIFNPKTGKVTGNINLSATFIFNPDSNSSPYAGEMALDGERLYILLQRRDGWNPGAPTLIITVNTSTDKIIAADTIRCKYTNGYDMVLVDGALYITNPGSNYMTGDGAIEKIDLAAKTVTTVMTEDDLGGSPNLIVHKDGSRFYVQSYVGWGEVVVVEIDAATGEKVAVLPKITDAYGGLAYDNIKKKLYVGERAAGKTGIRVFKNNEQIAGPVSSESSLPPSCLVLVR